MPKCGAVQFGKQCTLFAGHAGSHTYMRDVTKLCGSQYNGYYCDREDGHEGPHRVEGEEYGSDIEYTIYWSRRRALCKSSIMYTDETGTATIYVRCILRQEHNGVHRSHGVAGQNVVTWTTP